MQTELLQGVRVLDFGSAWAGPYAGQIMAYMGAEVIKIESRRHLDVNRERSDAMSGAAADVELSILFHDVNMNKMSVTIDLTQPKGVELVHRLVKLSDMVMENFRAGVMDKLGLGYATLQKLNPTMVMVSISTCGQTGPSRSYAGYATIFNALSGLADLTGYPDGPPTEIRGGTDLRVGTTAAFAGLAALCHRMGTGRGQHVDLSAWESISCLIGDFILGYGMNERPFSRMGNHDESMAPHNCYPCQGDDKWVSIAIGSDAEWAAFRRALGEPKWALQERFADALGRWEHQDDLDRLVAAWTRSRTPAQVAEGLQRVGVAAFPVMSSADLFADEHLKRRGVFPEMEHPRMGKRTVVGPPWKFSATPTTLRRAPLLGEHNEYVFGQLLSLPPEELERLAQEGVVK
ncbi:MAG: CoA transferase [Chloroflexi bacterium]|nr:CoA transferase [Chloroflexota bacterium]